MVDLLLALAKDEAELKKVGFLNTVIYSRLAAPINDALRYVSDYKLRLAMTLIQHLCVRLHTPTLRQQLIAGMVVLYHYWQFHVLERSEERIIEQLKDFRVVRVNAKTQRDGSAIDIEKDFLTVAEINDVQPRPRYMIIVPWTQCLQLVGHRRVLLNDGHAYLNYTQVAAWATQKWMSGFDYWARHDVDIAIPHIDKQLANVVHEKTDREFEAFRKRLVRDFSTVMLRDHYYSTMTTDLNADQFLLPVYTQLFRYVEHLDQATTTATSSSTSTTVTASYATFDEYLAVMAPCILLMYEKTVNARTHFQFTERFIFFTWAFKVGMPLRILMIMWTRMCEQDEKAVREGKVSSLLLEAEATYKKHESSQTQVNLHGCASIRKAGHCAFAVEDIEDIVVSQRACIQCVCPPESNWHQCAPNGWSPMAASRSKIKQR